MKFAGSVYREKGPCVELWTVQLLRVHKAEHLSRAA